MDLRKWFNKYVKTFKYDDKKLQQNIDLKEKHTLKVCQEILTLGNQLALNRDELRLAEIIALLHDVGRFEQYVRYKTFVDRQSENHAELGIKILKKNDVLNGLDHTTKNLIFRTIKYHNRASLPQEEKEPCLFFSKLLRDADKLDIWRVVIEYYHRNGGRRNDTIELGLPDTQEISEHVYQDIINKRIVDVNHIKNLNDFKVLQMGWVFDINFELTLHSIKSRRYLEMIREVLPETDEIQKIFKLIQGYMNHHTIEVEKEILKYEYDN